MAFFEGKEISTINDEMPDRQWDEDIFFLIRNFKFARQMTFTKTMKFRLPKKLSLKGSTTRIKNC